MSREDLRNAQEAKQDEFYTQLKDIEIELKNYKNQFAGKTVLCNCDDPFESNFFKYFAVNFNYLRLKKLIATCYDGSPITGEQLNLFDFFEENSVSEKRTAYKIEITEVTDLNGDGAVDLFDVQLLLKNNKNILTKLKGNGDFRSDECVELLKTADIVVTNPPFSLFREFLNLLEEHNKKYIIMGNTNALSYQEVFRLFKEDKIRTGYTNFNVGMYFYVPDNTEKYHKIIDGKKAVRVATSCWFTNLNVSSHNEFLTLYKNYNPEEYPHYDNYDAININQYTDIPCDYDGLMGVPITFLDKFNPNQFEIVGMAKTPLGNHLRTKVYPQQIQHKVGETKTQLVSKLNDGPAIITNKIPEKGNYYTIGDQMYISKYARLLIRRK